VTGEVDGVVAVMVVEDHEEMLRAIVQAVGRMERFEVVAETRSAEAALEVLDSAAPDMVLADMSLPQSNGAELVTEIARRLPDTRCIVISGRNEAPYVLAAKSAGARGYVLKGNPPEIPEAMHAVADGGTYFSPSLA
jgi:DNA-binding NarL/FixJ family response regulator